MGELHHNILFLKLISFQRIGCLKCLHRVQAYWSEFLANVDATFFIAELVHQQKYGLVSVESGFAVGVNVVFCRRLRQPCQE